MHPVLNKLLQGIMFGAGVMLVMVALGFVTAKLLFAEKFDYYVYKIQEKVGVAKVVEPFAEPVSVIKDFSRAERLSVSPQMQSRYVSNTEELVEAVQTANNTGNFVIYLVENEYRLNHTLTIEAPNITLMSLSGNPYDTIIRGTGMRSGIGNLFRVNASYFRMDGITLTDASYHLVQVAGEMDVDYVEFHNMIFQDAYQQLLKVSHDINSRPDNTSDFGVVKNSIFQFTAGIAAHYYTGGIDAIGATNWLVQDNIFRDIASPAQHIAQYAVHFWVNAKNNRIHNNIFVNNDRSIGFGMMMQHNNLKYGNKGGEISGNLIIHTDKDDPFADAGIVLEKSPETVVTNNFIFMNGSYPRAIEYRFPDTNGVIIKNNITNRAIASRDDGDARLQDNRKMDEETVYMTHLIATLTDQYVDTLY